jgi:DUF4097 and DUF4098 domain-containing protein YvlB
LRTPAAYGKISPISKCFHKGAKIKFLLLRRTRQNLNIKTTSGCIKITDLKSYSVKNNAISGETVPLS